MAMLVVQGASCLLCCADIRWWQVGIMIHSSRVGWLDGGVQTRQYCMKRVDFNLHPMGGGGGGIVEPQRTKIVCILCRDTV